MKLFIVEDHHTLRKEEAARNYGPLNLAAAAAECVTLAVYATEDETRWANSGLGAEAYALATRAGEEVLAGVSWPNRYERERFLEGSHLFGFLGWYLVRAHDGFDAIECP